MRSTWGRDGVLAEVSGKLALRRDSSDSRNHWEDRLERARLSFDTGRLGLSLGRMVLTHGLGKFFSATSHSRLSNAGSVDPDEVHSQDAVVLSTDLIFPIELTILPIQDRESDLRLLSRFPGHGVDTSIQVGRSDSLFFLAATLQADVGAAVMFFDSSLFNDNDVPVLQAILGIERGVGKNWRMRFEIYQNGLGRDSGYLRLPPKSARESTPYLAARYLGSGVQWEISPLWKFELTAITNLHDVSSAVRTALSYSIRESFDATLGNIRNVEGRIDGEFSTAVPSTSYFNLRWAW